jgi:hypothetical protein
VSAPPAADGLTRACGDRLAIFATQVIGGPKTVLPAVSDLCTDALVTLAAAIVPGAPAEFVLAQLLGLVGDATSPSDVKAALATVGAGDVDAAILRLIGAATPILTQVGVMSATARPPARPPARVGTNGATPKPPSRTTLAKWVTQQYGGKVPHTPSWDELGPQFASATALAALVPQIAAGLAAFRLREKPSSRALGKRVHERLQTAYRWRHDESFVVFDSILWREDHEYGDIASATIVTGDALVDQKILHTVFAYGFPSLGSDTSEPGYPRPEGRLFRPDILDFSKNKLFEIKSLRSAKGAVAQLWAYQTMINASFSSEQSLGFVTPGEWRIPAKVFPISTDKREWAFAFIFPGLMGLAPLPGIILYIVFERGDQEIEDPEWLERTLVALIAAELAAQIGGVDQPEQGEQPQEQPEVEEGDEQTPEVDSDRPDSWLPNGHYPGDEVPVDKDEDEEEAPWDVPPAPHIPETPTVPQTPETPTVPHSPGQPSAVGDPLQFVVEHWVYILFIVLLLVVLALVALARAAAIAALVLAILLALGLAAAAAPELAAAALVVLVVGAWLSSDDAELSPTTTALLADRGDSTWSELAVALARMPGMTPAALQSFGLTNPPRPPASA